MITAQTATSRRDNLSFPQQGFERLRAEGLLLAPLTERWGIAPGTHRIVLDTLRQVGARDLSLGRLYEGHVNALMLIAKFGDPAQAERDLLEGKMFGVWNTDALDPVTARRRNNLLYFQGQKAFGSGAGSVLRPIVTAEIEGEGRVMCLLPMENIEHTIDFASWQPLGMEGSDSFSVDFSGAIAEDRVILGSAGIYYRQPAFSGGAIRFSAVQLGAAEKLAQCFMEWLQTAKRTTDPYQMSRAGEVEIAIETGKQWIDRAGSEAELNFDAAHEPGVSRMVHVANMTRLAIERICLDVMELITRGVGARGLLGQAAFEKRLRDLVMYLRQPAPDQALAQVGKQALLRK